MRVLVTGASGLVGSNVAAVAAQQSWDVFGWFCEESVEIDGVMTTGLDMADRKACVKAASEFEPDVIVHAAGGVHLSRYEHEPYLSQLDYVGAEHTIAAARAVRARYVLVSCDWVHSGLRPAGLRFTESDFPDPMNAYGRSKLACEEATMRSSVKWLITRPGDMYGVNASRPVDWDAHPPDAYTPDAYSPAMHARHLWNRSGAPLRLVKRLRDHMTVPAPTGLQRSPTYAWDYAQRVCELVAQGCEGVYNMGGPDALGRRDWLELLADGFGCSKELVTEGSNSAFLQACGEDPYLKLPWNTALADEKARAAIGCAAVAPERGVGLMKEQLRRVLKPISVQAR